eukprot:4305556-Pyramimonas_sp.AAC.1
MTVENEGVGRMRRVELKELWINDLVARKQEAKVGAGNARAIKIAADIGAKHLSRIDFMKHLGAMGARLTGAGEVDEIASPSEEKTRCLVGPG